MRVVAAVLTAALLAPSPVESAPSARPEAPTPVLLERAVARGDLDRAEADRYLAYAFTDPLRVPGRFRGAPWEGTAWLLALRERLQRMPPGPERRAIRKALDPLDNCGGFTGASVYMPEPPHFHIHYTGPTDPPIANYAASLEAAWAKEVDAFRWAAPPLPPTNRYLVVVAPLGNLFGFVTPTAAVGDNPNTPWNEGDAEQSCMVLNSDYGVFPPSTSQQALESTTSHEFNHAIQFGYGALSGANVPDYVFVEGMTTWMEDEVFDGANDNYRYLWPDFADDMGQYRNNDPLANPYGYWVIWRAMVERFGTGSADGGEDVIQAFWEMTSRNAASNLDAMSEALKTRGTTLADAHHAAAIALRFTRPCGGGYAPPHCVEEGPAYVTARGPTPLHGQIATLHGSIGGSVADNYALNWIALPSTAGPFQARLRNDSSDGGRLKGSVVCDTGTGLRVTGFPEQAGPQESVIIKRFETAGCQSVVAVISNVAQTAANPSSSESRPYQLTVAAPAQPTKTTLRVRLTPQSIVATGRLTPKHPGRRMEVTLFERDGKRWDRIGRDRPRLKHGRRYRTEFDRPEASRCKVKARFGGDLDHLPSSRTKTLAC